MVLLRVWSVVGSGVFLIGNRKLIGLLEGSLESDKKNDLFFSWREIQFAQFL